MKYVEIIDQTPSPDDPDDTVLTLKRTDPATGEEQVVVVAIPFDRLNQPPYTASYLKQNPFGLNLVFGGHYE